MATKSRNQTRKTPRRLWLEHLEDRRTPAFWLVTGLGDASGLSPTGGTGSMADPFQIASLRSAIEQTNTAVGADTITFSVTGSIVLGGSELQVADSLAIQGPGAASLTVSGNSASRVINFPGNFGDERFSTISGVTLTKGLAADGGAVLVNFGNNVTLSNVTVTGNSATNRGGGVRMGSGYLTINNSTINSNSSGGAGGGLSLFDGVVNNSTISGNSAGGRGGGADARYSTFESCTFSGNTSATDGGGGYFVAGNLLNSTIHGNSANAGGGISGGGGEGSFDIANCTITGNTATRGGGADVAFTYFDSTILAGNTGGATPDLNDGGYLYFYNSLIGNNAGTTISAAPVGSPDPNGNFVGTAVAPIDPLLGPLANNGGQTLTRALLPGSPAINTGSNFFDLMFDQRGFARVVGPQADMGAYESRGFTLTAKVTPQSTFINTAYGSPLQVTLTETGGGGIAGATFVYTFPDSGPSASLSKTVVVTDANGQAQVTATANGTIGKFNVAASSGPLSATFALTNLSPPAPPTSLPPAKLEFIRGNITVTGTDRATLYEIKGESGNTAVYVSGRHYGTYALTGHITINGGNSADTFTFTINNGGALPGNVIVNAGNGNDIVRVINLGSGVVQGGLRVLAGLGNDLIEVGPNMEVNGLLIDGGAGNDSFTAGGGAVPSRGVASIGPAVFNGPSIFNGINSFVSDGPLPGDSSFNGTFVMNSASENLSTRFFPRNTDFNGGITVVTGGAADDLSPLDGNTFNGPVVFSVGAGNNLVRPSFFNVFNGDWTVLGSNGADTVTFAQLHSGGVSFLLGDGGNTVGQEFSPGAKLPAMATPTILGNLTVSGGNGDDNLGNLDATVLGSVKLQLGNGRNSVNILGDIFGAVRYTGGSGVDSVTLTGQHGFAFFADFGAGADVFTFAVGATVGSAQFDFGAGTDTLNFNGVFVTWPQKIANL